MIDNNFKNEIENRNKLNKNLSDKISIYDANMCIDNVRNSIVNTLDEQLTEIKQYMIDNKKISLIGISRKFIAKKLINIITNLIKTIENEYIKILLEMLYSFEKLSNNKNKKKKIINCQNRGIEYNKSKKKKDKKKVIHPLSQDHIGALSLVSDILRHESIDIEYAMVGKNIAKAINDI